MECSYCESAEAGSRFDVITWIITRLTSICAMFEFVFEVCFLAIIFILIPALVIASADSLILREAFSKYNPVVVGGVVLSDALLNRGRFFSPDTCRPRHGFDHCLHWENNSFPVTLFAMSLRRDVCFERSTQSFLRVRLNLAGLLNKPWWLPSLSGETEAPVPTAALVNERLRKRRELHKELECEKPIKCANHVMTRLLMFVSRERYVSMLVAARLGSSNLAPGLML